MKEKIFTLIVFSFFFAITLSTASAQSGNTGARDHDDVITQTPGTDLRAVIQSDNAVSVGRRILFDASDSFLLTVAEEPPVYIWNFGDGTPDVRSKEVLHDFQKSGYYTVTLKIIHEGFESVAERQVFAYTRKILLITEPETKSELSLITEQAAQQGVYVRILTPREDTTSEFLAEEDLIQKLSEDPQLLSGTDTVLFYTRTGRGLQAFNRYFLNLTPEEKNELSKKFYVHITDRSFSIDTEIVSRAYQIIKPKNIIITRKEALNPLFEAETTADAIGQLIGRGIEFSIIDERSGRSFLFFLSSIVSGFSARGVPSNIIHLLLAFPFIAFIITFARQVIGALTFGVFIPAMLSTAFLIMGVDLGLVVVLIVIGISYLIRMVFDRIELLYIPRVGLLLSCISLSLLLAVWFQLTFKSQIPVSLSLFPMLFMSTISEKFISAQMEEGTRQALKGVIQTLVVSVIAYLIVSAEWVSQLIISIPEIVFFPLLVTFLIGRFTGLRLTEYLRFRSLLKGSEGVEE